MAGIISFCKVPKDYPCNENNRVSENKGNVFPLSNGRLLREAKSMRII